MNNTNSNVPTDIILTLFETLNSSDKLTREQLKELTKVMTKLVFNNESRNCTADHKELRATIDDGSKDIESKLNDIKNHMQKDGEITELLTLLTGKVTNMIFVVKVAFGLISLAALIGTIVVKFMN